MSNIHWQSHTITQTQRAHMKQQKPILLWFTGLSGAGKSTIANIVEQKLFSKHQHTYLLDGDNLRHGLNHDLGFNESDRIENIRRVGEISKLFLDAGLIVLSAFISPFKAERDMVKALVGEDYFIEIYVDTSLVTCESRDTKGLYQKARNGEIINFTGIDSPYEIPENPDITLSTDHTTPEQCAEIVLMYLNKKGYLSAN